MKRITFRKPTRATVARAAAATVAAAVVAAGGYAAGDRAGNRVGHREGWQDHAAQVDAELTVPLPDHMNRDIALAAARRGAPFVAPAPDCRLWVRLPDSSVWSMSPLAHITRTGERLRREPGLRAAYLPCDEPGPAAASGAFDPALVDAARRDGVPYVHAAGDTPDGCHAWLETLDDTWAINRNVSRHRGGISGGGVELGPLLHLDLCGWTRR